MLRITCGQPYSVPGLNHVKALRQRRPLSRDSRRPMKTCGLLEVRSSLQYDEDQHTGAAGVHDRCCKHIQLVLG